MLKEWEKSEKPSEEEIKARLEAVKEKLARQQLLIKEKKGAILIISGPSGCGKSTCSSILATLLYLNNPNKKINLFELDDNNETKVDSKYIDSSSLTLKHTETVIDNINFNQLIDPDYLSVLDSGGSNDSVMILNKLKEIDMVGNNFYIPINDDLEQFKN